MTIPACGTVTDLGLSGLGRTGLVASAGRTPSVDAAADDVDAPELYPRTRGTSGGQPILRA